MEKYKIALVDDHALFRRGTKSLLEEQNDLKIVWEAGNGKEMIDKITNTGVPDLVVMDVYMPVMNGVDAAAWLKQHYPQVKILSFSMYDERERVLPLVKVGVNGYILKTADDEILLEAVKHIRDGDVFFPRFITRYLAEEYRVIDTVQLNAREIEFIKLCASELTYKEIANKMQISARTAEGYREQLFTKLDVKSRQGLILYAIRRKLIDVTLEA